MGFFSKGLKNEFETAVVNEPSVFEPLKFYCIWPHTIKKKKERRIKKQMASYSVLCELVLKHFYTKQTNIFFFKCKKKWSKTPARL